MPVASLQKQSGFDTHTADQALIASGQIDTARPSTSLSHSSRYDQRPSPTGQRVSSDGRFNMLRYRHASDPQLSTRFKQQEHGIPPTPPSPDAAPAPVVGFTSPKRDSYERPRSVKQFWARQQSFRARSSYAGRNAEGNIDPRERSSIGGSSRQEQSPRPSTAYEVAPPPYGDLSRLPLAPPAPRLSGCSSASEEPFAYAATTTTSTTVSTTTTFFKIPRRKNKKQESLFPLPARPALSDSSRAPSEVSLSKSPKSSPYGNSPAPSGQLLRPNVQSHSTNDVPLLRSSTWNAAVAASSTTNVPAPSSLPRHNSTASAPTSPLSGPSFGQHYRERSGTIDSTSSRVDEDPSRAVPMLLSGGNSAASSTLGRNSIYGLRSLTSRLRHPSDSLTSRNGSPGLTLSQNNSFALSRDTLPILDREEGETAGKYFTRLEAGLPKKSIATLLSKSADPFNHDVLRSLMRTFKFYEVPLDMAIRQFLWEIDLPGEAQQIDRVISAFAERYHECNPHIFINFDQVYLVAYSLIILHSDLFNKNNKRKMQKNEYQKNTGGHGIDEEILGYFYDNIQWAEFIAQDSEDDIEGKTRSKLRKSNRSTSRIGLNEAMRSSKIDPYDFIIDPNKELDRLGPSLKNVFSLDDTYNYQGPSERLNIHRLREAFRNSGALHIISPRSRPEAHVIDATIENQEHKGLISINVAKVGVIWRKDVKRRKTQRPWQQWGAILSHSRLYFFRNAGWVRSLVTQYDAHVKSGGHALAYKPALEEFKPDFSVDTNNAVALLDASYDKHKNAFVLSRTEDHYEEVLLADNEADLVDWIARINYAATFTTTGYQVDKPNESPADRAARVLTMPAKVAQTDDEIPKAKQKLEERLRNARHLCMLAPFPSKTRGEMLNYGARIAHRIRWSRFEVWKLQCRRDILSKYLELDIVQTPEAQSVSADQSIYFANAISPRTSSNRPTALSRLNSKASALMSPQKAKMSRATSSNLLGSPVINRPKENDKTDQASVTSHEMISGSGAVPDTCFTLPPLALGSGALGIISDDSTDSATERPTTSGTESTSLEGSARQISLASVQSRKVENHVEGGGIGPVTPVPSFVPIGKDNELTSVSSAVESVDSDLVGSPDRKIKGRRSLQRTLRETRDLQGAVHQHRSRKGKDSISSLTVEQGATSADGEGILRGGGSFTLHGKKASIINLGSEWQNMSPEERLRVRKQGQGEDAKPASPSMSAAEAGLAFSSHSKTRSSRHDEAHSIRSRDMSPLGIHDGHLEYSPPQSPASMDGTAAQSKERNVFQESFSTMTGRRLFEDAHGAAEGVRNGGADFDQEIAERMQTFYRDTSSDDTGGSIRMNSV